MTCHQAKLMMVSYQCRFSSAALGNKISAAIKSSCLAMSPKYIIHRRLYHSKKGVYGCRPVDEARPVDFSKSCDNVVKHCNIYRLASAYREYGHEFAQINPLSLAKQQNEKLNPSHYGISDDCESKIVHLEGILYSDGKEKTISEVIKYLKNAYCGPVSIEFFHVSTEEERRWLAERFENLHNEVLTTEEKCYLCSELIKSQVFDNFLATKFSTVKRYSGEGAESMIGFFIEILSRAVEYNISNAIIGMAHRGRLNLLTGLLKFPPVAMFQKMKGMSEFPNNVVASGDVLSHLTSSIDLEYNRKSIHVTMLPNPSHLEAVSPVVVGKARARLQSLKLGAYSIEKDARSGDGVLPIQIHGDGSLSGQGIIMETLAMSKVPHFDVGGSIHFVINNQLGYTTPGERGRSSLYCSDVMKMISAPIIHVNGDYPEEVVKMTRLALEYRQKFRRDVLIDLVCFRRWGHNEMDDPTFTNPVMYDNIHSRQSVPDLYAQRLIEDKIMTIEERDIIQNKHTEFLNNDFKQADSYQPMANYLKKQWSGLEESPNSVTKWNTGMPLEVLKFIGGKSVETPEDFSIHQNLNKVFVSERLRKLKEGKKIDWATAEALAIGSLLYQGFNVRISGQDVGRGTFSQRHAMLVDQSTNEIYIPLNHMMKKQKAFYEIANSILSEEAVLAFEYGMSIESPNNLIIWEAQFGDFFNGAQIIIDTFISSGETKWLLQSGLVMLLPHGYDGAGPEHSSCHLERFLQNCDSKEDSVDGDDVNWCIANPTTPAQYFHLLRRQLIRNFRKPLIVASPKVLLRLPAAVSSLSDMQSGTIFSPVIGDNIPNSNDIRKVILCSGKLYYTLQKELNAREIKNTAVVRLEALCPFPAYEISQELKKYKKAKKFVWCQEEHQNMGAWFFIKPRFENILGIKLSYVGRNVLATAAVGIGERHQQENSEILEKAFTD